MEQIVAQFLEAPIPNTLIVSGIFLIVASFVDKIATMIVKQDRRTVATIAGFALIGIGVFLHAFSQDQNPTFTVQNAGPFLIQMSAHDTFGAATNAVKKYRETYPSVLTDLSSNYSTTGDGALVRVRFGPFLARPAAAEACRTIEMAGGECFVTSL